MLLKRKTLHWFHNIKCGNYRIDFIVKNQDGIKVAIECDGDKYHGIEQFESDLDRQSVLERCGWKFIRIRASEYYYNKEEAINKILNKLNEYYASTNINYM